MAWPRDWATQHTGRPAMRSPGRPSPPREVEREFWRLIATGVSSEDAAAGVGVSAPVGSRWFRHGGGMPPMSRLGDVVQEDRAERRVDVVLQQRVVVATSRRAKLEIVQPELGEPL